MKRLVLAALAVCNLGWQNFAADVAQDAQNALAKVAPGTITYADANGWLYSKNELAHLAKGELAQGEVARKSACCKAQNANPLPALAEFHHDLKALGIQLILVPVPPKAAIEPFGAWQRGDAMAYLKPFYGELRAAGLTVLDLSETYAKSPDEHFYCRTDAHWNPAGMAAAAQELAKLIDLRGNAHFEMAAPTVTVSGDLAKSLSKTSPQTEEVVLQTVSGKSIDETSPVLLIGDSHTLVFSAGGDMLAENAGLAEQLARELTMPIDRIGVKGSAATAVRVNLYRKAAKKPEWLKNKKFVVYCFSCREFTESTSGWTKVPVTKPAR